MRTYLVRVLDEIWEVRGRSKQTVLNKLRREFGCPTLRLRIYEK